MQQACNSRSAPAAAQPGTELLLQAESELRRLGRLWLAGADVPVIGDYGRDYRGVVFGQVNPGDRELDRAATDPRS
ncbi:MAG: hypothetical protein RIQ93_3292 [Verrucomicrobiota bacterium]|jgi:hypothetical protein